MQELKLKLRAISILQKKREATGLDSLKLTQMIKVHVDLELIFRDDRTLEVTRNFMYDLI